MSMNGAQIKVEQDLPISQNTSYSNNQINPGISKKTKLQLGYFQLRGKAQVARLLLEHLGVPYQDFLFQNNKQWIAYKNEHQKSWPFLALPFLIDGDTRITEAVPICNYIISKFGGPSHQSMLGRNFKESSILEMYSLSIEAVGSGMVSLCWMQGPPELITQRKQKFWIQHLSQKMQALQVFAGNKPWMLGYLSLFDFSIYELIHYMLIVFPKTLLQDYPRLMQIQKKVHDLPAVKAYENSTRAIKAMLPSRETQKT